jgi:hypothetical protein
MEQNKPNVCRFALCFTNRARKSRLGRKRKVCEPYVDSGKCPCVANRIILLFPVPVCAITASGVPGGSFVSMNRFSTLCG